MSVLLAASALLASTLNVYDAPDADQGVAVDDEYFYAIDNFVIAKHRRSDGKLIERWDGGNDGPIGHLNSCIVQEQLLECANSNYPAVPMASSIEYFSTESLEHVGSHSLGVTDEGSLTWTDKTTEYRLAGFAHYSEKGGEPFKDNNYGAVVVFDRTWRRTGGYSFPPELMLRMSPYAASGGALGSNGLLYVMGHDLPEMYVLAKPQAGPYLLHVATIELEAEGQAFSFEAGSSRIVWVVDRRNAKVRRIQLPRIELDESVQGFGDQR